MYNNLTCYQKRERESALCKAAEPTEHSGGADAVTLVFTVFAGMSLSSGPSLPDAPWSQKCRALFPVLEELGRKYRNHSTVTVAKIDITANDIQLMYLDRYPFFRLFPTDSQQVRSSHNWKCVIITDLVSLYL